MEREEDRWAALRGLVPTVLTVAVIVGGVAGGRAGGGTVGVLVAVATAAALTVVLGGLALAVLRPGPRRAPAAADLAARWAEVEPVWSGRRPPRSGR